MNDRPILAAFLGASIEATLERLRHEIHSLVSLIGGPEQIIPVESTKPKRGRPKKVADPELFCCGVQYKGRQGLEAHRRSKKHAAMTAKPEAATDGKTKRPLRRFKCNFCQVRFVTPQGKSAHERQTHREAYAAMKEETSAA